MVALMGMVPSTHPRGCFHLASFMEERRCFVTLELHEGWVSYIVTIFLTMVNQNAIEDELLQFLRKEGQFASEAILL
jgi:hypothetical protein